MRSRGDGPPRDPRVRPTKFPLGGIYMTPGISESVGNTELLRALRRHADGDWGNLDADDRQANERAVTEGGRILSAYESERGVEFWIITEADRSATTALLPSEY